MARRDRRAGRKGKQSDLRARAWAEAGGESADPPPAARAGHRTRSVILMFGRSIAQTIR
jgi:hypothetical protein